MKTLNRLLLLLLAVALVGAAYGMHTHTTQINLGHDTYYVKWPWLQEIREVSIFAVLGWCLLFLRSEPAFARIGLAALIIAFAIMNLRVDIGKELAAPSTWRLEH